MQQKNIVSLEYLDDNDRLADLINGFLFRGKEVVHEQDILELDTGIRKIIRRFGQLQTQAADRDLLRKVILGTVYLIVGIEHQSAIDFTMPLRVMGYDVGTYEKQLRKLKKMHRKNKDLSSSDFIAGMSKSDKLIPVCTIVLYFGAEEWSGPQDLHGLLNFSGALASLKNVIPNYKINILDVRRFPHWQSFRSDLRQVFGYLQHLSNAKEIRSYVNEHKTEYNNISEDAYDLISSVTNAGVLAKLKEKYQDKKGDIDMCKALDEWAQMERHEGKIEGRIEGKLESTISIICKKSDQGLSVNAISYWLELDCSFVEKIEDLHKKHPKYNEEKLAQTYLKLENK